MNCPFCAEQIKPEAIVCPHCQRDLMFFRRFDDRVAALESAVGALRTVVTDQIKSQTPGSATHDRPVSLSQLPNVWRRTLAVVGEVLVTAAILGMLAGLDVVIRPSGDLVTYADEVISSESNEAQAKVYAAKNAEVDLYSHRLNTLFSIFLPMLFLAPVCIGLFIGLRWPGRNLKWYIALGGISAVVEILLFMIWVYFAKIASAHDWADTISAGAVLLAFNVARCVFGFATGGLFGDWIEKRRLRLRQTEIEVLAGGDSAPRTVRSNKLKAITDAVPIPSILTLVGVIVTSYVAYQTALIKGAERTPGPEARSSAPGNATVSSLPTVTPSPLPTVTPSPAKGGSR